MPPMVDVREWPRLAEANDGAIRNEWFGNKDAWRFLLHTVSAYEAEHAADSAAALDKFLRAMQSAFGMEQLVQLVADLNRTDREVAIGNPRNIQFSLPARWASLVDASGAVLANGLEVVATARPDEVGVYSGPTEAVTLPADSSSALTYRDAEYERVGAIVLDALTRYKFATPLPEAHFQYLFELVMFRVGATPALPDDERLRNIDFDKQRNGLETYMVPKPLARKESLRTGTRVMFARASAIAPAA